MFINYCCQLFAEWAKHIYYCIRVHVLEFYYWHRTDNILSSSCNLSLIISPELFGNASKIIRTKYRDSTFSLKHKKTLIDDVMHTKYIGTIVLSKTRGEYGDYYHDIVDGNSRLIALSEYLHDKFSWNHKRFSELSGEKRIAFLEYKIQIKMLLPSKIN